MKAKFKSLFGWFRGSSYEWIGMVIFSTIVGIAVAILIFPSCDLTPATPEDYNELYDRLLKVEGNKEEFFNGTGTIQVLENEIIYEIENKECKMRGTFNSDLELISSSQEDKKLSLVLVIAASLFIGVFAFYLALIASFIVIFGIELIVLVIIKIKRYFEKRNFVEHGFGE